MILFWFLIILSAVVSGGSIYGIISHHWRQEEENKETKTNRDPFKDALDAQQKEHMSQLKLFDEMLGIKTEKEKLLNRESGKPLIVEAANAPDQNDLTVRLNGINARYIGFDAFHGCYMIKVEINDHQAVIEHVKINEVIEKRKIGEIDVDAAVRIAVERRTVNKRKTPNSEYLFY